MIDQHRLRRLSVILFFLSLVMLVIHLETLVRFNRREIHVQGNNSSDVVGMAIDARAGSTSTWLKRSFVLDEIHRRGIPYRETENGFEAQQCYTDEIRQVEKKYRPQKSSRGKLRDDIDRALMQSKDFDEFLSNIEPSKSTVSYISSIQTH